MVEAPDQHAAPSATGTLGSRPLVHLLVYARNRRLSGALRLRAPDGREGTIELWRGRIRGAQTAPPVAFFGGVAHELGVIDTVTLDATLLEISRTKRRHGQILVERGSITPAQRDAILSEQMCRKIDHLFSLPPEATFEFYDARPALEEPAVAVDPIKPVWRFLRESSATDSVREVVDRYAMVTLRLSNESPVTAAGFNAEESALCEALALRPMTLAQLRTASTLPSDRVDILAYLLVIAKCAEPAPTSTPSMPAVRPSLPMPAMPRTVLTPGVPEGHGERTISPSNMPQADSGEVRISLSFRVPSAPPGPSARSSRPPATVAPMLGPAELGAAGIAHRAQSVDGEDFFVALGVPDGASIEATRSAYFRLAKVWHPDRLPAEFQPFRDEATKIFAHMTQANATLTDPSTRKGYLATRRPIAAVTTIASRPHKDVVREIEQAIGKRDFLVAEQTAHQLTNLDADDADALALAGWASIHAGEASEEVLRAAIPLFDKAVHNDTYCQRAHFYRGVVHKRLGNPAAAFRDFTRVMQLNPSHVDAQREIRILEMRARKGSGEHALDALIGKTKKK